MLSKLEIEARTARGIAESMAFTMAAVEGYWPPSKRGSNAQREWDRLKEQLRVLTLCLDDRLGKEAGT